MSELTREELLELKGLRAYAVRAVGEDARYDKWLRALDMALQSADARKAGIVTVPVEPTEAMVMAYLDYVWDRCEDNALNVRCLWQAMLRAAAEPVSETGGKG